MSATKTSSLFNGRGDKVVVGSDDGKAYLLDGNTFQKIAQFKTEG